MERDQDKREDLWYESKGFAHDLRRNYFECLFSTGLIYAAISCPRAARVIRIKLLYMYICIYVYIYIYIYTGCI